MHTLSSALSQRSKRHISSQWENWIDTYTCTHCHLYYHSGANVTLQVNGRTEFSGSRPVKTTAGIKMKCGTIDYVGGGTPHAKVGSSQITGGVSPYGWHVPVRRSHNFFFDVTVLFRQAYRWDRWTDFHARYVKMRGSEETAFFSGLEWWRHNFRGSKSPKTAQNWRE